MGKIFLFGEKFWFQSRTGKIKLVCPFANFLEPIQFKPGFFNPNPGITPLELKPAFGKLAGP